MWLSSRLRPKIVHVANKKSEKHINSSLEFNSDIGIFFWECLLRRGLCFLIGLGVHFSMGDFTFSWEATAWMGSGSK